MIFVCFVCGRELKVGDSFVGLDFDEVLKVRPDFPKEEFKLGALRFICELKCYEQLRG